VPLAGAAVREMVPGVTHGSCVASAEAAAPLTLTEHQVSKL
jgi:hypothetical protein